MKKPIQDADYALFRAAVEDAVPLRQEVAEPYRERPPPRPRPRADEAAEVEDEALLAECEVTTYEYLAFVRPGVQRRLFDDLQRGRLEPGLVLDLHGLSAEHARRLLRAFLRECAERRLRCAQIIHGKGYGSPTRQPVLKCKVNYWLRLRPEVLAFCSATRRDGGTGAVYVLLRNPDKGASARRRGG
ncbi:MAG: DNA mismatch repair protein MutS [Chromatiaceae bacterium]|nr:MAG: DNA mismatch repair protein MutS [Chromatiaceae bacterium]